MSNSKPVLFQQFIDTDTSGSPIAAAGVPVRITGIFVKAAGGNACDFTIRAYQGASAVLHVTAPADSRIFVKFPVPILFPSGAQAHFSANLAILDYATVFYDRY